MKSLFLLVSLLCPVFLRAQIPVTDVANLVSSQLAHVENIAKWVDSINNLRVQIDQLRQQIDIQKDIRQWSGNPADAGSRLFLGVLGVDDLVRDYGRTRSAILGLVGSLDSLGNTASGSYRAIANLDIDGKPLIRDPLTYRRYAVLDAVQANTDQVTTDTKARERELQEEVALTLDQIKSAPTEAEVHKLAVKLNALNGQVAQVEAARKREVDAVALQKIANDARHEEERLAAAELASKDDYLANQRITAYMKNLRLRKTSPDDL